MHLVSEFQELQISQGFYPDSCTSGAVAHIGVGLGHGFIPLCYGGFHGEFSWSEWVRLDIWSRQTGLNAWPS